MKRALITGSAGFLGSHVVEHLLTHTDWEIVGIDSFRHRGDSLRVKENPRYMIHCCDLSAPISHRVQRRIGKVDYILNIASESHVDRSIEDPVPFVQNNVNLALNVFEYARVVKPEKVIQFGTDESYGPAKDGESGHKEWSAILPSNPYAASKACQEAIAISYWRTYGLPIILTNGMNIYGLMQDPEKYIPMLVQKITKGQTVTVHGTPAYIGKRTYIHAYNVADALLFLLREIHPPRYEDGGPVDRPERFNIVGDTELDNLELAQKVAAILEKPLHYELVDFHFCRKGHDRLYKLDKFKLENAGWKQPINFESSLKETIQWTVQNPDWTI